MIRIGERTPMATPRRVALGVDKWMALHREAEAAGLRLPPDVRVGLDPLDAALAGVDVEQGIAEATALLREHGVLDDDGPVPAVAANLAAIGSASRRVRVSVAGEGLSRLGYAWVDTRIGGSLVRDGHTYTLSLFDSRALGTELLALLPEPESARDGRAPLTVPLDAVGPVAGCGDAPDDVLAAMSDLVGLAPAATVRLRDWSRRNRAVLHVTVAGAGRPSYALVWFLHRDGWWSGRTSRAAGGRRLMHLEPCDRADLPAALATLTAGAWL